MDQQTPQEYDDPNVHMDEIEEEKGEMEEMQEHEREVGPNDEPSKMFSGQRESKHSIHESEVKTPVHQEQQDNQQFG